MNVEQVYDKLYRYVYFKIHHRETAEDITQETFLRYLRHYGQSKGYNMRLMYVIARNLCMDEYRRERTVTLEERDEAGFQNQQNDILERLIIEEALAALSVEEREMLLLRYVNNESVMTISELHKCSRFATYRKIKSAVKKFQDFLEVKDDYE